ncbi:unnamed protein product [Phaeothamnion confervicola]
MDGVALRLHGGPRLLHRPAPGAVTDRPLFRLHGWLVSGARGGWRDRRRREGGVESAIALHHSFCGMVSCLLPSNTLGHARCPFGFARYSVDSAARKPPSRHRVVGHL